MRQLEENFDSSSPLHPTSVFFAQDKGELVEPISKA